MTVDEVVTKLLELPGDLNVAIVTPLGTMPVAGVELMTRYGLRTEMETVVLLRGAPAP